MIKKLGILFFAAICTLPALAQSASVASKGVSFGPKAGDFEVKAVLGASSMFSLNTEAYLVPEFWDGSGSVENTGLNANGNESSSPALYISLDDYSSNSIVNMVGLKFGYFVVDELRLSAMVGMNYNLTPKKDYIEGDNTVADMQIPGVCYVEGTLKNNWYATIGAQNFISTRNDRINFYYGIELGAQMGIIQTQTPYSGVEVLDPTLQTSTSLELYSPNYSNSRIMSLTGAISVGAEYEICKGMVIGLEVQPISYAFTQVAICPPGYDSFISNNHNIRAFTLPTLQFGFRF